MGMAKHRKSGHSGKSPKFRLWQKKEAEKPVKKRKKTSMFNTVKEALSKG